MSPGAIVNIAGSTPIDDPEYRYKMPLPFGKIEGRGNGIKTNVSNCVEISHDPNNPCEKMINGKMPGRGEQGRVTK